MIVPAKKELRRQLLEWRRGMPEVEYAEKSARVVEALVRLPVFRDSWAVHCFASMQRNREPDTWSLLAQILESGKRLIMPRMMPDRDYLNNYRVRSLDMLVNNKMGIAEPPAEGKPVHPGDIDLVVVPMLAGDEQCNRLGYGKGHYDRFLSGFSGICVGLCFEDAIVDSVPVEETDVPLHVIITERRMLKSAKFAG